MVKYKFIQDLYVLDTHCINNRNLRTRFSGKILFGNFNPIFFSKNFYQIRIQRPRKPRKCAFTFVSSLKSIGLPKNAIIYIDRSTRTC